MPIKNNNESKSRIKTFLNGYFSDLDIRLLDFCEKLSSESIFSECCYSNSLQRQGKSSKVRLNVYKVSFYC